MENRGKNKILPATRKISIRHTVVREINGEKVRKDVQFRYEIAEDLAENWDAVSLSEDVLDILYEHDRIERNAANRDQYHHVTEYREGYSELALPEDEGILRQVIHRTQMQQFLKALEKLSDKQRKRLILYDIHGFSLKEIARMEGVSHKAIQYSIQTARKKIKKLLKNDFQNPPSNR